MVQHFLSRASNPRTVGAAWALPLVFLLLTPCYAAQKTKTKVEAPPPELLLEGGRKLSFERSFSSEKEVRKKPGFWGKVINVVAGDPDYKTMARPYSIAADSHGRIIVTDPGLGGVHVFDLSQQKYKFLERQEKRNETMWEPQCVAVDSKDNIYVTDSKAGKIFVWDSNLKFRKVIGNLKGGEGFFKRPTGITIDPETQNIYITDTLRDRIYVLDPNGQVMRTIGQHGDANGEFNYPTEVLVKNGILAVVDAMNFRVQTFDRNGKFLSTIGAVGDSSGQLFRPKGIGLDSEDHIYLVEGLWGVVQVFDRQGQLLYNFGKRGANLGEFQLPTGLFIDAKDRVYVVDSLNHRIQIFQYQGLRARAEGAKP